MHRNSTLAGTLAVLTLSAVALWAVTDQPTSAQPASSTASVASTRTPESSPAPTADPIPAPDFEIPVRSGETFRLSDHRGKVVLLNLWATWCPPCRHEIPDFIELQSELGSEGLTVIGVALDDGGWEAVGPFADEMGINYPIAVDDGTVDRRYGPTSSFPTTFLIDRAGNVRHYIPGMILRPDLEPLLAELLAEPAL